MSQISIDTSTPCLFVSAKTRAGQVISYNFADEFDMSAELLSKINELQVKVLTKDKADRVSALYTTLGPGSFTGLRVGISTLKGISAALNIPIYGLSTLKTYAFSFAKNAAFENNHDSIIIPMLDARKSRYYCQVFNYLKELKELTPPLDISIEDLISTIYKFKPKQVYFVKGFKTILPTEKIVDFSFKEFDILNLNNPASILFEQKCDLLHDEQGPLYVRDVDAVKYKGSLNSF